ncbi:MAG: hypothetical protein HYX65_10155 [Gemmatimonadetes bacterium]|nr:hypothetical protein [Gemmatimonadota bacterium]
MRRTLTVAGLALALLVPATLRAQLPVVTGWLGEARVDVTPFTGAQVGAGASEALSFYGRVGAIVAAGVRRDGADMRGTMRIELHGRVSADPIQELRWAPYLVGGAMLGCAEARRCRPLLLLRIGLEGPMRGGWIPGAEIGVGDGLQLGFVLRAGRAGRR